LLFCPLQHRKFICSLGTLDLKSTLYEINVPPDDTQKHTTSSGIPLEEGSARRIKLYLATYNTLQRRTNIA